MANHLDNADKEFEKMVNKIFKDLVANSKLPTGLGAPFNFLNGAPTIHRKVVRISLDSYVDKTVGFTDDEKIDYYVSRKILKDWGVEI